MEQLEGFKLSNKEKKVEQLYKALYSLDVVTTTNQDSQ